MVVMICMEKISILRNGIFVELYEYVEDFYLISKTANKTIEQLRKGLSTWISSEKYKEMNLSVWVYYDTRVNAFCYYDDGKNYIALSLGLLTTFLDEINDFVNQENLSLIIKLSEENKPELVDALYFYMLNFTIAHEFGHIAHGHLRARCGVNGIDEMLQLSSETTKKEKKIQNWLTQLKEYDADSFAVTIQSLLFLQRWEKDINANLSNFDAMFIANYLCFRAFAEKTGRNFDGYLTKEIDEYDHPHPGIRMYYSYILYSDWIGRTHGFGDDTLAILASGSHAVVAYERSVLEKKEIKECYYSVAYTEKGAQHFMNLHNGWQELVDYYNQYSYIPIEKMEYVSSMPVSVDERGYFINK